MHTQFIAINCATLSSVERKTLPWQRPVLFQPAHLWQQSLWQFADDQVSGMQCLLELQITDAQ